MYMKNFVVTVLLTLSGVSYASPVIPLDGGTIGPNSKLTISFEKLQQQVNYTIHCSINVANATIMHFTAPRQPMIIINDITVGTIGPNGVNGAVNKGDNALTVSYTQNIGNGSGLGIENLDNNISATVTNCTATPS